jgi:hypothetical protein
MKLVFLQHHRMMNMWGKKRKEKKRKEKKRKEKKRKEKKKWGVLNLV